ncbi:MAG: sugar phosphate isomerase/epimerase [Acidobacteriota bacterium]|nr:sugar phosphate isomerase/epimerase [Acidobacteriota bacterium]
MAAPAYRFAICNEIFQGAPFPDVCKQVQSLGYQGIELAPYTLAEDATLLGVSERTELRTHMADASLEFVGLHWLLMSPPGLHITSPDQTTLRRSWDFVHRAIDLCADLAGSKEKGNGVIVFGSPKQRSTEGAMQPRQAIDIFTHELAHTAPHAESRGVTLLVEAIPASQTDVITCLADAVAIVKQIGSPAVRTMFDVHNAVDEQESHPALIRRFFPYIRHIHVNETDGQEPGRRDYDFGSILSTLSDLQYSGWVSVEAFDFSRPPLDIAQRAISHLTASERTQISS